MLNTNNLRLSRRNKGLNVASGLKSIIRGLMTAAPLLLFWSCGEDSILAIKETYYLTETGKSWLSTDSIGDSFIMKDQNGITQSFTMDGNKQEFSKSWGGYFFITTHITHREQYFQNFSSTYGINFSLNLSAFWDPYGDELRAEVGSTSFSYNFNYQSLSRVGCGYGYIDKLMTDKGYDEGIKMYSEVIIIDSLDLEGFVYHDVLHFSCHDLAKEWEDYTVKEIYLSKNMGLIKYVLQNGLHYTRSR